MDLYQVVYIDKFTDIVEAELAAEQLKKRFKMNDKVISYLSSGKPVVIKKNVSLSEAERFKKAIEHSGGVCWIQLMTPDGVLHERRRGVRRTRPDRRTIKRACSIQPDRRKARGRRSTD